MESLVQPITTTIVYSNGEEQRNRGNGFVIGDRFYTAYHNIQPAAQEIDFYRVELGGLSVQPLVVDIDHDLAAFEIPRALCLAWCNDLEFDLISPEAVEAVSWIRLEHGAQVWKRARVSNLAFKADLAGAAVGDCEDNLIVEIDQPFVPGSSGGPVFDATSGAIVGLIQGSFESRHGRVTGYYKPAQCVLARLALP